MSIKMYGNLTANQLISGGRLILSVELKTKILNYCATHQISAHALPRDAEELVELFRFMDWDDAATIPSLTEALGTKLLAFVRNNITSDKLRPGLIEVQDPDTKVWTATWKMYTLAWAEEGGFVWGNIINELDLETMDPALKQDREPEVRPYIAPAALVGQTVAFVVGVDSKDVRAAEEVEGEGDEMEEVIQQQRPRTSLRVQQQTANRLQQQQAAQLAQQQADNFLQQQQAANILQQQQAAQEAAHILQQQQAAQVVTQQAEALRVEAERVEAQRVANEQMAQHLQHLASQAAEAEAKRVESERSASQRLSQSLLEAKQMDEQYNAAQHANDAAKAKRVEAIRIEAQKVEAQRLANERQAQELANQAAEAEQKAQLLQDMQSQILALRDQMAAAAAADRQANQYSVLAPNHYSAKPSQAAEIAIPAPAPKFVRPADYAKPTIPAPAPPAKAKAIKKVAGKDNTIQAKTGTTAQEFDYQIILADTLARSAPPQQQKATSATTPNYESILANVMAHRGNKTPTNWAPVAPTSTYKQIQADAAAHKANVAAPAPATKPNSTTTSKAKTAISASYDAILAKLVSGSGATADPSTVPKVAAMTKNSAAITAAGMGGLRRSARVKAIAAGN